MKRLSPSVLALVCSISLAVIGFVLLRGKTPLLPNSAKTAHLTMQVQKPTILDAFEGVDAVCVLHLEGADTDAKSRQDSWRLTSVRPYLELKPSSSTSNSWVRESPSWRGVWKSRPNGTIYKMNFQRLPPGQVRFYVTSQLIKPSTTLSALSQPLSSLCPIDRTQIQPFDFNDVPFTPQVRVSSVRVLHVALDPTYSNVDGEVVFDLLGPSMNAQTPFEFTLDDSRNSSEWGIGARGSTRSTATKRIYRWSAHRFPGDMNLPVHLTGSVSANNRWPLNFEFEPFVLNKIKPGQTLKFKSRLAHPPSS